MDVLVYVDPLPRGEWALGVAAQLSSGWAESLQLLATAEDLAAEPSLLGRARGRLAPGALVSESVRPGPAEQAVVAEAKARRYGLVVVPPAGRGAVARMLKGSRVATVVRRVRAPVLVARRPPARIERVLGALSGRGSTGPVLEAALAWETHAGARAAFVHVRAEVAVPLGTGGGREAMEATPGQGESEAVRAELRSRGREGGLREREGLVVEEVLDEYEAGAHHLLVIGARGEAGGFGREDLTERLLLRCPGSTLIVGRGLTGDA
jgi:nucleotide-binding universal stress UspA family protein